MPVPTPTDPRSPRLLRCCVAMLALLLLPLAPTPASAQPWRLETALAPAVAPSRPVTAAQSRIVAEAGSIDTSDRTAVASAYRDVFLPAVTVNAPTPSPADVSACDAGTTPEELQDATLELVNYFRAMSQVPAVTFDPALSAKAQQAALMMYANRALSHTPPSSWDCYSAEGAEAAGSSNLGLGYPGASVVAGYMDDNGSSNTEAGHRWWLQRPSAQVMGSGTFGTANALWVLPTSDETPVATPAFTSWPTAGYFPAPLEPAGRWSFSPTDPTADLSSATVSVTTGDGTPVTATAYPVGRFSSLVFEVGQLVAPSGNALVSYDVTVSGVQVGGQPVDPYRYTVQMIDPAVPVPVPDDLTAVRPATVRGSTVVGATLTAAAPQWSEGGVRTTFRWLRDGHTITGATKTTYRLVTKDVGHRFSVRVTGHTADDRTAISTSSTGATVTKIRSVLAVTATSPAVGRVRLSASLTAGGKPGSGVLKVRDGAKTVARTLKVVRGVAVYQAKAKPGRHRYTLSYAGSARVSSATSAVAVSVRNKVTAHLTVRGTSTVAKKVTFRITVAAAGQDQLGGSVKITRGSATVATKVTVRHGTARYTAKKQPKGKQKYTVTYRGTASVRKATATLTVKVKAPLRLVAYPNCASMNADHAHGVGRTGASDSTSGTPVTNFLRSNALYAYNDGGSRHAGEHDLDRDNDGIACER